MASGTRKKMITKRGPSCKEPTDSGEIQYVLSSVFVSRR